MINKSTSNNYVSLFLKKVCKLSSSTHTPLILLKCTSFTSLSKKPGSTLNDAPQTGKITILGF